MGVEVLLGAALFSGASIYSQNKAVKANQRATEAQRRAETLKGAVQRRREIKNFRAAQAMALQAGENQGVVDSSGTQGGVASIGSQLNANLSFLDNQTRLADFAGKEFDKSNKWEQNARTFAGLSDLTMAGYNWNLQNEQQKQFEKMFGNG